MPGGPITQQIYIPNDMVVFGRHPKRLTQNMAHQSSFHASQ
jgi:hypothetical protein